VPTGATARALGYEAGAMAIGNNADETETSVRNLAAALSQAIKDCGSPAFRRMQQTCMSAEVSWAGPAASWHAFVEELASEDAA
jgi:glycogen synthase